MMSDWNGYCIGCGGFGHRASGCFRGSRATVSTVVKKAICWKATDLVPVGYIGMLTRAHPHFLWMNGALVSKREYAELYALVGDAYAAPGDSDMSTFRLPDERS